MIDRPVPTIMLNKRISLFYNYGYHFRHVAFHEGEEEVLALSGNHRPSVIGNFDRFWRQQCDCAIHLHTLLNSH